MGKHPKSHPGFYRSLDTSTATRLLVISERKLSALTIRVRPICRGFPSVFPSSGQNSYFVGKWRKNLRHFRTIHPRLFLWALSEPGPRHPIALNFSLNKKALAGIKAAVGGPRALVTWWRHIDAQSFTVNGRKGTAHQVTETS